MFDIVDPDFLSSATEGLYHRHIMSENGGLKVAVEADSLKSMPFIYADADHLQLKDVNVKTLNLKGIRANKAFFHKVMTAQLNADYISLRGATLYQSILVDASFVDSDLTNIVIEAVFMQGTRFNNAILEGANINMADLRWADFTGCDLEGVVINNSQLYAAVLKGVNLGGADLQGCIFSGDSDGSEADADIKDVDFSGCILNEADFARVIADGAEFTWAEMFEVNFEEAKLVGADFTDAQAGSGNFTHADMQSAVFLGASLEGANLEGADCSKACFYEAKMAGAFLTNTNFTDADFTNADLRGADFTGANTTGANFTGANIDDAIFDTVIVK